MKGMPTLTARPLAGWIGRAFCCLGLAALGISAWLGWTNGGAQASLETLWSLCGAP